MVILLEIKELRKLSTEDLVKKIKDINKDIKPNKLLKFIKYVFKYSKIVLNKYSNRFSKHDFTQPALFTLLAVKIYTRSTYRQIIDLFGVI